MGPPCILFLVPVGNSLVETFPNPILLATQNGDPPQRTLLNAPYLEHPPRWLFLLSAPSVHPPQCTLLSDIPSPMHTRPWTSSATLLSAPSSGFHKRAGGSEAVQSELAAALLASCGNLKVLALEEATVWGSTFYERLADGLNNSCSSSSRGCKGLQEASSPSGLVEGHVEPVCHLEGGSSSSLSGQIGEHADTVCHKESTGGSDTAIYTAFHRSAQAAAGCLDSQVRNLHLQKNGNRQVQSDSAQSPAPGGRSPKANSPPKESRDRQCQSSTLQAPASEGCFPKATPPPKEERDTQGRTDTFHAPFHALPSSTRPTHSQQPALCSSTWMHLHTLKLPTSGCMCFQPELRAIAALRSLQHLQLGQVGAWVYYFKGACVWLA
eukprot:1158096-Pelagomonas_calceolata.AAC.2